MNHKKIKMRKKSAAHSPKHGEESAVKGPSSTMTIGIIGWNSPRFAESHGGFLKILQTSISAHGSQPLFLGISGGADLSDNGANGKKSAVAAVQDRSGNGGPVADLRRSLSSHYGLPSRDIVADQIEMLVHEESLDALVMVPWSVNSLVGMLMASARCGVPTLFCPNYRAWPSLMGALYALNRKEEGSGLSYSACSTLLMTEVLGMTRIGTFEQLFKDAAKSGKSKGRLDLQMSPAPGAYASPEGARPEDTQFYELAEWAGRRIVEMSKQKISPKRFFTEASFHNAICVDIALGSSAEAVLHLSALAQEAGVQLPLSVFNETAKKIVQLVAMDRAGEYSLFEFEEAGGLYPLLGALHSYLQPSPTVMGKNIIEIAKESTSIRSPFRLGHTGKKQTGGLAVLFGNLAQQGAIFRLSGLKEPWLSGSGPARVFNAEEGCVDAIVSKKIKKGEVLVVRYSGPRGRPGMPPLNALRDAIAKYGLEESHLILTDGRVSLPGKTPAIVHLAPEAAVGSAMSILEDGDLVTWNAIDKTLTVRLTETEIKVRLSRWKEQERNMKNSFLYRYAKYSSSSALGAVLS